MIRRTFQRNGRRRGARRGPERSPHYRSWICSLPCVVCGQGPNPYVVIEAAHTSALGPRGISQKSSDFSTIPLCLHHHRAASDSYHALGERAFAQTHGLNIRSLVAALNEAYGRGACRTSTAS